MAEFEEIYETYVRRVYRFLLALTGDPSEAEELTQQTFYQAFLHIEQFQGRSSLFTWLCQIGKNEWFRECRRLRRFTDEDIEEIAADKAIDVELVKKDESRRAVFVLCQLEQPYRDVVILRIYGQLAFSQIALLFEKQKAGPRLRFSEGRKN